MVWLQSTVSRYKMQGKRPRLGDKLETLAFDPECQKTVLFKEVKKIKTLSGDKNEPWMNHTKVKYPDYFNVD